MCKSNNRKKKAENSASNSSDSGRITTSRDTMPLRRGKRVKQASLPQLDFVETKTVSKTRSSLSKKYEDGSKSGGIDAILPSLGIVLVLAIAVIAKNGWRGRSTVAGVDLGTTNSVICIQKQSKGAEGEFQVLKKFFEKFHSEQ
jgi:hypothetical protein